MRGFRVGSVDTVIGCFLGDGHVMDVALTDPGVGDAHETGLGTHLGDVVAAGVAHAGAQPAGKLVDDGQHRALVGHPALDALGHQLLDARGGILEVTVAGALGLGHRPQGAHAAVGLVGAALEQLHLARRLVGAGEQAAEHHRVAARGDGLGEIAGVTDAAVGDERHTGALERLGHVGHGGDLGHAHAGHHAGGADGAGADAHLHRVGAGGHQVAGRLAGGDVAADDLQVGKLLLDPGHAVQHALGMAVGGVHHQYVDAGLHQRPHPVLGVAAGAHSRADAETALIVLAGVGLVGGLLDVLDGNHAAQLEVAVDHQHLLDAVLVQQRHHLLAAGALAYRDQALLRSHDGGDRGIQPVLEAQIAVGDDAHQVFAVHHRHAGNLVGAGQLQDLADAGVGRHGDGIDDHPAFILLDQPHLACLLVDGHVLVDDADTTFLRHRNSQARLRHCIHCCRNQRYVQRNTFGELCLQRDLFWQYL